MRKLRYQAGSVQCVTRGKQNKKFWLLKYRDLQGVRRTHTLEASNKTEARTEAATFIASVNREREARQCGDMTLGAYAEQIYIPFGRRKWKASTASTTEQRLHKHVIAGELAQILVSRLDRKNMQAFLDSRALLSRSVVNHLRFDLQAICRLAVGDGLLERSQAAVLFTPSTCSLSSQPVMSADQVQRALAVLDLRERTFCRLAIYAGMRPGEIIALKWTDIKASSALVDDRFYKGVAGSTKNRRARTVALSPAVVADLEMWRALAIDSPFIFASDNPASPIRYENLWQRYIKPRFKKIGIEWADFRCMRRTNSTLMQAAGADAKVAADNRGHGVRVALEEYTHSTLEQKTAAVKKLEGLIN